MFDTHCHIHFKSYDKDREEVYLRTREKGVKMITVGTQTTTSKTGIDFAEAHEGVWCTVGLHPSHTHHMTIHEEGGEDFQTREEAWDSNYYRSLIASSKKVVAVGEVGLDFFRLQEIGKEEIMNRQEEQFRLALDMADEVGLPIVLHIREAHTNAFHIIDEYIQAGRLKRRGVAHCFTGTREEAKAYTERGFYISFGGIVTFKDRKRSDSITPLQEVVASVPIEWILLETDAPYLTPEPHRGERNEPWMVQYVAETVARVKSISVDVVEEKTDESASKLFDIKIR